MAARTSIIWASTKYFVVELIGDIVYFPLWWFTAGFSQLLWGLGRNLRSTERHLALGLLLRTLWLPMFGQYDREGRIISFFVRLVILFGRWLYWLCCAFFSLVIVIVWLGLQLVIIIRLLSFF